MYPASGPTAISTDVKSLPEIEKLFGPTVLFIQLLPKEVSEVADNIGVTAAEQRYIGLALLRGLG